MNLQSIKQRFGIIGRSKQLDIALETANRVANTELSVLITGESGVGKEAFSKIIHQLSARKHNNFIPVNCGAIPPGTINSELFGHEKGAFTGATSDRKGYFETVDGGTIFLDEIGEMPLDTQVFLLRILENGEFLRVGSTKVQKTDVRIIAATNVNLRDRVQKGKFREDLYYRLNTVPIKVPPLRERRDDIHMLFRKFVNDFADKYRTEAISLDEKAQLVLENYRWPGNIRELKNAAEQISVMSTDRFVTGDYLIDLIPNLLNRNLPMVHNNQNGTSGDSFQEREILYKLLFEMKSDLTDLKSLVFELIEDNNLRVPDLSLKQLKAPSRPTEPIYREEDTDYNPKTAFIPNYNSDDNNDTPYIINREEDHHYDRAEVVEENLSLENMERELIEKALKKHKGRRKDASLDLGISERTLYRKIKQYEIIE